MAAPKLISYTSTGEDEKAETFYERKEYPPPSPGDGGSPAPGVPPPAPAYLQAGGYSRTSEALDPRYTGPISNPNHLLLFKVLSALAAVCILTAISAVLAIELAD